MTAPPAWWQQATEAGEGRQRGVMLTNHRLSLIKWQSSIAIEYQRPIIHSTENRGTQMQTTSCGAMPHLKIEKLIIGAYL